MIACRLIPLAVLAVALLRPVDSLAVAPPHVASNDVDLLVKTLAAPGPRDRAFLDIPPTLLTRLAIDPAAIRSIDPGLVCDLSFKAASLFQARLGQIGQVQTVCTPAGWSQGMLTLKDGTTYVTTCGDSAAARVTANVDVTAGSESWHGAVDSARPVQALSHSCSGWTKAGH